MKGSTWLAAAVLALEGPAGLTSTFAGDPRGEHAGLVDGTGPQTRFDAPMGLAMDDRGNLYVADSGNNAIRKIAPNGRISTLAGGPNDARNRDVALSSPAGVAVTPDGATLYVADQGHHCIRRLDATGHLTTLAGDPSQPGAAEGTGAAARFWAPTGIALGANGTLYVSDKTTHNLFRITPGGKVTLLAGPLEGAPEEKNRPYGNRGGGVDGPGPTARFNEPCGLAVDRAGMVYVADRSNHAIRKVTPAGEVTTLAGNLAAPWGGYADGPGERAAFYLPRSLAVDGAGTVYVGDGGNACIRKVTPAGVVSTFAGDHGHSATLVDGPYAKATFGDMGGLLVEPGGRVWVADTSHHAIRKVF